jgi:exonuclease III
MPPSFTIATQNVGGMRGEFQKKHGPKFGIIRQLAKRNLNFCVLTEVRCDLGNIKKSKVSNMKPSLHSVSREPRGGVLVYSHPDFELINHSVRRSSNPGHFAIGVYLTPTKTKLIVGGIYGPSANNDRESSEFYNEVKQVLDELTNTFNTNNILLAGDFNAVLNPTDSSSEHHTKKNTTTLLNKMMEDLHLVDLATRTQNTQHTWFRRNNNTISSRLDMILTNLPISNPKYSTKLTIFDHAWVQASFGQKREHTNPTMKDYVLGSEEFLIRYYDLLENELRTCLPKSPTPRPHIPTAQLPPTPEEENSPTNSPPTTRGSPSPVPHLTPDPHLDETAVDEDTSRKPMDEGLTAHNPMTGRTDLHFLNSLIKKVGSLHNEIDKSTRHLKEIALLNKSKRLYFLHKQINKNIPQATRQQHQDEFNDLQRDLRLESEVKDKAKQLRIQNFYKSKNGKLNATSFYSVKDRQPSRTIKEIWHNDQSITDPEEIVKTMQEWYEVTASRELDQAETLTDMLHDLQMELPQISPENRELLDEEISQTEIENAINEAQEVSAPGPTGQTITLYKLLIQSQTSSHPQ